MSTRPSERAVPSKWVAGALLEAPASIAGLSGRRWKSPFAGSTNFGSAWMLPFTPAKLACVTIEELIIDGVTSPAIVPQKIVLETVTPDTLLPALPLSLDVI